MYRSGLQRWGVGLILFASSLLLLGTVTQTPILFIVGFLVQVVSLVLLTMHTGDKHSEGRDR
ncbi:hypothetical protein [Terribacillus saccharophilus]|uniref:Uncharacterized protein n=1 Tax=Terribacillus saccharophilus TaxID=361277 RepID=A0A268AC12_9BACI|nr:hypothetical protein [Terribacillus saccharophilus]PAD21666.1 hypothetical protein CHH64_07520 [Terribacillus saccharophilus]PAF19926.1 hypothetical protein CHH51_00650 [Terribacillus saccharophilus]PAF21664.1 hypothetical protein CHH49_09915 [Terribacillus saccharophilus]PAF35127.1 hypothetical protein CHH69_12265 [Terribacillus saccharophilus]PAF37876.1 hypothetical protein CHH58_06715 [Terribacillus saccharophilus]